MKKVIKNRKDIELLVDTFYGKVRENELLAPVFDDVIKNQWPAHLEKMYRFWETVLLDDHTYFGGPFGPHAKLPIAKKHFDTWLQLFEETLRENFMGEKADEALWRARKMAEMFNYKIEYFRNQNKSTPLK